MECLKYCGFIVLIVFCRYVSLSHFILFYFLTYPLCVEKVREIVKNINVEVSTEIYVLRSPKLGELVKHNVCLLISVCCFVCLRKLKACANFAGPILIKCLRKLYLGPETMHEKLF